MNASRDQAEVAEKMESITIRLFAIEEQQTQVIEELNNLLKARVKDAVHELSEYLNSRDIRVRFTSWNLDEVPKAESSWELTKSNISKALESRLQETIEHWEKDNQVFSDARKSLFFFFNFNFLPHHKLKWKQYKKKLKEWI